MAKFANIEEFNKFIEESPVGKEDKVTGEMIVDWCVMMDKVDWLKAYRAEHPRINLQNLRKQFYLTFFPNRVGKPAKKGLGVYMDEVLNG